MMYLRKKLNNGIMRLIPERMAVHKLNAPFHKSLLFTFDDGPNTEITPLILDTLKEYNTQAIFFLVGRYAEAYPDLVRRIHEENHLIGNHTYHHHNGRPLKIKDYLSDLNKCGSIISDIIGEKPVLFRPPRGEKTFNVFYASILEGLILIYWTASGKEWTHNKNSDYKKISESIYQNLNGGEIILLHDNNHKAPQVLKNLFDDIALNKTYSNNGIDYIKALMQRSPSRKRVKFP